MTATTIRGIGRDWTLLVLLALLSVPLVASAEDGEAASTEGDDAGVVRCANLIYADNKSSVCFSHHFLADLERETNVKTADKFTPVRLDSMEMYQHPFAVMTGEGGFTLTPEQREGMRNYLTHGGFLVASAGCSSSKWSESFEREVRAVFPELELKTIELSHPIFHTVYDIDAIRSKRTVGRPKLKGLEIDGRIVLVYSSDGLNDTANAGGNCCCCGGNEIFNARQINVNLLAYALTH